jgi:TIR domain
MIEASFWKQGHFRLFICHLAERKDFATSLQDGLANFHISAFVAHRDIEPTREWQDEIELALNTADAFVALLAEGFHASKWTDQEIGFAMGRGIARHCRTTR